MIHIVVLTGGTDEEKEKAKGYFKKNPGWTPVLPDVWLLAARANPRAWQDFLVKQVPGLQFLMVRLANSWGAGGVPPIVQWLNGSSGWF